MSLDVTTLALAKSYTNQHGGSGGDGWPSDLPKPSVGGYGYTEQGEQTVITWDGDTDGRVDIAGKYYKISELTPTIEEMIGGVVYLKAHNDGIFPTEITAGIINTLSEHIYIVRVGNEGVLVALEDVEIEGIPIERGMYYSTDGSEPYPAYISSLTYGTPDTVHKIDEKYMPEGYPTKIVQTTTLMEEQEVAFKLNKGVYAAQITNAFEAVKDQTYTVNWDGTEYEVVCVISNSMILLGNASIVGMGDNTGEPFLYGYDREQAVGMFVTHDTSASHTISVKTTEETITPMAEEFLPAGVGTTAFITYDLDTNTYSADLTNDELHARLLDGKQIVLYTTDGNEYLYLTKWKKVSSGRIDLAFAGDDYSVSLFPDGTIGKYIMT